MEEQPQVATGSFLIAEDHDFQRRSLVRALTAMGAIYAVLYRGVRREMAARTQAEQALVAAKEAADTANRAKSTFLATMSHEIRTPMHGVLGVLELLGTTRLDSEQYTTLEIVRQSGKSLLRIIDDILDVGQVAVGSHRIKGASKTIGAEALASVCELIERASRANDLAAVQASLGAFDQE